MKSYLALILLASCGQLQESQTENSRPTAIAATENTDSQGPKGDKGDTGPAGTDGKDGEDYNYAKNVWIDPMTNQEYCIGSAMATGGYGFYIDSLCPSGWHLPSETEARTAVLHGVIGVASELWGSALTVWTTAKDSGNNRESINSNGALYVPAGATQAGVICLENDN